MNCVNCNRSVPPGTKRTEIRPREWFLLCPRCILQWEVWLIDNDTDD